MDARIARAALIVAAFVSFTVAQSSAASHRTTNFIVQARSPQFAKQVGDLAEMYRRDLAIEWLGEELPRWGDPCPIRVDAAPSLGAGGATSFMFDRNRPFGWTMSIQGSKERILDSVLPHEVTHTIFATHFGSPLPRWADEGACTTVEHPSERAKQQRLLLEFLSTNRGIAFNRMFAMTEYPRDILPLYSQGHSLAQYLIAQGGKRKFIEFVGRGMQQDRWNEAVMEFYGHRDLSDLQLTWVDWVRNGSPAEIDDRQQLAASSRPPSGPIPADRSKNQTADFNSDRGPSADVQVATAFEAAVPASRQMVQVQPRNVDRSSRTPISLADSSTTPAGSWYAQQKAQAQLQQPTHTGRIPRTASRPQQVQQAQEHVLDWNSSARIPIVDHRPIARSPVHFDAPTNGAAAYWR